MTATSQFIGEEPLIENRPILDRDIDLNAGVLPHQTPNGRTHRNLGRVRASADANEPGGEPDHLLQFGLDEMCRSVDGRHPAFTASLGHRQPVLLDAVAQRIARDTEKARGLADVPARRFEGPEQRIALHLFEVHAGGRIGRC